MPSFSQSSDSVGSGKLSIVLISPDEARRKAVSAALLACPIGSLKEVPAYPANLDDLPRIIGANCDVVVIDLDANSEAALTVVESICAAGSSTVIACSAEANIDLAVRCMRAGVREFLKFPLDRAAVGDALARIAIRGTASGTKRKTPKKLFVFMGAKGGCGVTTLASNFAVSLAQESGQSALLIDLGQPLGDAALNLGMVTEYSTVDALEQSSRLDASFLTTLLAKHPSGLSVLAAPTEFTPSQPTLEAFDRLLTVARQSFDYVIIDGGSRMDLKDAKFFDDSATLYLVTQVGLTELRNANRMIGQHFISRGTKLQIIVNRYGPHALPLDDKQIEKALTHPIDWKVPDDYATARRTQNLATPLAMEDSQISRVLRRMARKACGLPEDEVKGQTSAGLLGWARRGLTKVRDNQTHVSSKESSSSSVPPSSFLDPGHAKG